MLTANRKKENPLLFFINSAFDRERTICELNALCHMEQIISVPPARANATDSGQNELLIGGTSNSKQPVTPEYRSNQGNEQSQKRKYDNDSSNRMNKKLSRAWDGSTRRQRNVDSLPEENGGEKEERRPKKKVACFIGYSGEGYHGMQ